MLSALIEPPLPVMTRWTCERPGWLGWIRWMRSSGMVDVHAGLQPRLVDEDPLPINRRPVPGVDQREDTPIDYRLAQLVRVAGVRCVIRHVPACCHS
jgi:hypothetical protein